MKTKYNKALKEVKALLEKDTPQKKESKRWRAEKWGTYWYVDRVCYICNEKEEKHKFDNHRHLIGNYFRTREQAERYKEINLWLCSRVKEFEVYGSNYFLLYKHDSQEVEFYSGFFSQRNQY